MHASDAQLVASLRRGDEGAFEALVDSHASALLGVAMCHVASRPLAEEAVKRTWLRVIRGLDRFDGRASLRTWIFRLLAEVVETRDTEASTVVAGLPALATLPAEQRAVVTLRDIEGWPAGEACAALGLEETDQRRLLHGARTAITGALALAVRARST